MAPADSWPEGDGMLPGPSSHQDQLNRQMIRHLMTQYSQDDIMRLLQEESQSSSLQNDAASVFTSSTHSSVKSEDAASVFDSGSSIRTFSDTSSSRGSIISNVSGLSAKLLSRKSSLNPASKLADSMDTDDSSASGASKQKGAFMCGFCKEEGIQKTCTRKNDLKRHIEDFHNMNAQWRCRHRGCSMVFDWQTAYKTHLKVSHGGSRTSLDDAKIVLCPQTVFACGFDNCTHVSEAAADDEASAVFKEYVSHVVKHFDEGNNSGDWTYSTRIRNLLRQSGVMRAWNNSSWPEAERGRLKWSPQTSGILRKRLETRHIGDLQLLIQYAILTGSNPNSIQKFREDFITPNRDQCQMTIPGHKIRAQNLASTPMESEPPQFRISRNVDPSYTAYLASQRRVHVPTRAPVRSGRSARPPVRSAGAPSAQPPSVGSNVPQYVYPNGASPMYDQQRQRQPSYSMMSQVHGGIIAEDLSSIRSMVGHGPDPDAMDMGDSQMVDPGYVQPQQHHGGFAGQYMHNDMQNGSVAMSDCGVSDAPSLDHHQGGFMSYSSSQQY